MLLLLVVALIATRAFYKTAVASELHPGRAASAPWIGLGVILALDWALLGLISSTIWYSEATESTLMIIEFLNLIFVAFVYIVFIRANYRALDKVRDSISKS